MSTNAIIGITNDDSTVTYIYNHWDGYPEYLADVLCKSYNVKESVRELMSYGDVSSLTYTLEESEFYHRDRNEKMSGVNAVTVPRDEFLKDIPHYAYLFEDGQWKIFDDRKYELLNKWA